MVFLLDVSEEGQKDDAFDSNKDDVLSHKPNTWLMIDLRRFYLTFGYLLFSMLLYLNLFRMSYLNFLESLDSRIDSRLLADDEVLV